MSDPRDDNPPLVTLLVATYNRAHLLGGALRSAVEQTYENLEILVCRDGGEPVRHVVDAIDDPRIRLLDRDENRGLPYTYNRALEQARGKYVAYLGDDDFHYPDHIASLVAELERHDDPQKGVAFSDLYRTLFHRDEQGNRVVVAKDLLIDRDFSRLNMMFFNHVLGGSMMHRRDLIDKIGLFDESLRIMIDWDLNRRLAMMSDFLHVRKITGEYFAGAINTNSDRISDIGRKDETFGRNCLRIRQHRPPKPWPKMRDVSIIVVPRDGVNLEEVVAEISRYTFWPHLIYLPIPARRGRALRFETPNVIIVDVKDKASPHQAIDAALPRCEGDYVAIHPAGAPTPSRWLESPTRLLDESDHPRQVYLIDTQAELGWAGVGRRDELLAVRRAHPDLSLRESLSAGGFDVRSVPAEPQTFRFGDRIGEAFEHLNSDRCDQAADVFASLMTDDDERTWLQRWHALALYHHGRCPDRAGAALHAVNGRYPTVNSLWMEARLHRQAGRHERTYQLLTRANEMLQRGLELWKT